MNNALKMQANNCKQKKSNKKKTISIMNCRGIAVLDSIIMIQNSLHLTPFSQQPQNHLKKQES